MYLEYIIYAHHTEWLIRDIDREWIHQTLSFPIVSDLQSQFHLFRETFKVKKTASLRLKISYKYKDQSGLGSVLVLHHLVTLSQCYCVTLLQCHSVTVLQCYCVTVLLYYCATVLLCWGQTSDCSHNSPVSRQGSPTNLSRILPWERFTIWLKIGKLNLNRFVNMLAISFHD